MFARLARYRKIPLFYIGNRIERRRFRFYEWRLYSLALYFYFIDLDIGNYKTVQTILLKTERKYKPKMYIC